MWSGVARLRRRPVRAPLVPSAARRRAARARRRARPAAPSLASPHVHGMSELCTEMSCAFLRLNKYDTHARAVRETQIRGSPQSAHMTRAVERPARTTTPGRAARHQRNPHTRAPARWMTLDGRWAARSRRRRSSRWHATGAETGAPGVHDSRRRGRAQEVRSAVGLALTAMCTCRESKVPL